MKKNLFIDKVFNFFRSIILLGIVMLAAWLLFYPIHKIEEKNSDGSISILIWSNFGRAWVIDCEETSVGVYTITRAVKGNITEEEIREDNQIHIYYYVPISPLKGFVFQKQSQTDELFSRTEIVFNNKSVGTRFDKRKEVFANKQKEKINLENSLKVYEKLLFDSYENEKNIDNSDKSTIEENVVKKRRETERSRIREAIQDLKARINKLSQEIEELAKNIET